MIGGFAESKDIAILRWKMAKLTLRESVSDVQPSIWGCFSYLLPSLFPMSVRLPTCSKPSQLPNHLPTHSKRSGFS